MKKTFRQFEHGTAAYVIAHAKWMTSRGRNPSMQFLTEKNPCKALASAKVICNSVEQYQYVGGIVASQGEQILKQGRPYNDFDENEVTAVARHIVTTSESEEQLKERLETSLGCSMVMVSVLRALTQLGREAKELCLAMGGLTMKDGSLVQVMFFSPRGEIISL